MIPTAYIIIICIYFLLIFNSTRQQGPLVTVLITVNSYLKFLHYVTSILNLDYICSLKFI
jgi:hypothetical protein